MYRWLAVAMVGATVGCGDGSASDRFPDDIDTGVTLDQLSDSAFQRLCSTFEDWVYDQYSSSHIIQAVCLATAIETTQTTSACGDELQSCLDTPPPAATAQLDAILAQAGCAAVDVERTGCSATVGQIQDCLDALSAQLDNLELTLTCAAAGQPLDDGWWQLTTPSACSTIEAACP